MSCVYEINEIKLTLYIYFFYIYVYNIFPIKKIIKIVETIHLNNKIEMSLRIQMQTNKYVFNVT